MDLHLSVGTDSDTRVEMQLPILRYSLRKAVTGSTRAARVAGIT